VTRVSAREPGALRAPVAAGRDGGLSDRAIVDAARKLIVEAGVEGLTMRRLSAELGVTLGATYRYVPSKRDLLVRVADDLFDEVTIPESGSWTERVKQMMIQVATIVGRHWGMAEFLNTNGQNSPPVRLRRGLLEVLADAGFTPDDRTAVIAALFFYVTGMCVTAARSPVEPAEFERLFEKGLDMLLDGAEVSLRRGRAKSRKGQTGTASTRRGGAAAQQR
jgi:AcrR family transcriptional regulator